MVVPKPRLAKIRNPAALSDRLQGGSPKAKMGAPNRRNKDGDTYYQVTVSRPFEVRGTVLMPNREYEVKEDVFKSKVKIDGKDRPFKDLCLTHKQV